MPDDTVIKAPFLRLSPRLSKALNALGQATKNIRDDSDLLDYLRENGDTGRQAVTAPKDA